MWIVAACANALATGMGMVLLYAVALRFIPYRRLMTLMAYFQMSMSFDYGRSGLLSSRISGFMGGDDGFGTVVVVIFSLPSGFSAFTALAAGFWNDAERGHGRLRRPLPLRTPSGGDVENLSFVRGVDFAGPPFSSPRAGPAPAAPPRLPPETVRSRCDRDALSRASSGTTSSSK